MPGMPQENDVRVRVKEPHVPGSQIRIEKGA